jgi:hypothetical protein
MASTALSLDGLLCALVVAPQIYARNRFFELFEQAPLRKLRRRAKLVRGMIRQLVGITGRQGQIVGEQVQTDGRVLIRYIIPELNFSRTTALSSLEATLVRYVVARARHQSPDPADRARIEQSLGGLAAGLPRPTLDADAPPDDSLTE